ncbi:MAG: CopG family transcriptional regulator [Candidatus Hydrogenedentes bacterium]|nr:CopG family transcriptional regulator [Candidatus Hydrogenedentota bacterium]
MKAKDFDRKFDAREDITKCLDMSKARRPGVEVRRVNVDIPAWMINSLDRESERLGVPRQSLIKFIIAQHLEKSHSSGTSG